MKYLTALFLMTAAVMLPATDLQVVCTTLPVAAMTRGVLDGIPGVQVSVLLPKIAGCPHDYSLTPADMKRLASANMIVINGLGMESFLDGVTGKAAPNAVLVDSSKGVKGIECEEDDDDHEYHHEGEHGHHHHHAYNEHLFASPSTAAQVVLSIAAQMEKILPAQKDAIRKNAENFAEKLNQIAEDYRAIAKKIPDGQDKVFVQHEIFAYLVKETGLESEGCILQDEVQEPSAAKTAHIVKEIRKEGVRFILAEPGRNSRMTEMIAKECRIPVVLLQLNPTADSPEEFLAMFRNGVKVLEGAVLRK